MVRRLLVGLALVVPAALAQNLPLPPLPYDYNALEPHIDVLTMKVHHLKHHQTYTDKLNGALTTMRADPALKHLAKMGIDALLQRMPLGVGPSPAAFRLSPCLLSPRLTQR